MLCVRVAGVVSMVRQESAVWERLEPVEQKSEATVG